MRAARVFRWTVRIFVLFLTGTMTAVSVLGGLSAVQILSNPANIQIADDPVLFQFNSTQPEKTNVSVPFYLNNDGYYSLNGLNIAINITLVYNSTSEEAFIFRKNQTFPNIPAGSVLDSNFEALNGDGFIPGNFPESFDDPNIELWFNISVSARYSLDLLSFSVNINNLNLWSDTLY
ncbi:MAG: hypothetical protein ACQERB_10690 [Promethearchaeati archaeon]